MAVTIAQAHEACSRSFKCLCKALDTPERDHSLQIPLSSVVDEHGRFNVWAGNIGAHQLGRSSLDYRLREASQMRGEVIKLLQYLRLTLDDAYAIVNGDRLPYEELSSDSDSDSSLGEEDTGTNTDRRHSIQVPYLLEGELQQLSESISDIVTNLYKLSTTIRKGNMSRDRLVKSSKIDISFYEPFDLQHAKNKFPLANEDLINRLGKAISRRRQYLKYREKHHEKLSAPLPDTLATTQAVDEDRNVPKVETKALSKAPTGQDPSEHRSNTKVSVSLQASTTASTFVPPKSQEIANNDIDVCSEIGTVSSYQSSTAGDERPRLPPPPQASEGGRDFECPYCYTICRFTGKEDWQRRNEWKRHIFRDLQPYMCTYLDCSKAGTIFERRGEWFRHETQVHRREWCCNVDGHDTLQDKADFVKHMEISHPDMTTPASLPSILDFFERPIEITCSSCPLCLAENSMNLSAKRLEKHLGRHLEALALFALPSKNDASDGESVGSDVAARASTSSDSNSHPPSETQANSTDLTTFERLRDASGKGEQTIVDHLLKIRPKADTESVLVAARGGHDVVLGLLLAIGDPDPDPEPLKSGNYIHGFDTPMLAAIGRGNAKVISLLVAQPGFNPKRRLFKDLAYYEIAEQRQGLDWKEEYYMLREAYDNYKATPQEFKPEETRFDIVIQNFYATEVCRDAQVSTNWLLDRIDAGKKGQSLEKVLYVRLQQLIGKKMHDSVKVVELISLMHSASRDMPRSNPDDNESIQLALNENIISFINDLNSSGMLYGTYAIEEAARLEDLANDLQAALEPGQGAVARESSWDYIKPKVLIADSTMALLRRAKSGSSCISSYIFRNPAKFNLHLPVLRNLVRTLLTNLDNLMSLLDGIEIYQEIASVIEQTIWLQEDLIKQTETIAIEKKPEYITTSEHWVRTINELNRRLYDMLHLLGCDPSVDQASQIDDSQTENSAGTRLGEILRAIAVHVIETYEPHDSLVMTPSKMIKFYEEASLPNELYPWPIIFDDERSFISRMYRDLACEQHLVQEHNDERPDIPGLTPAGFENWATMMVRAHPEEEYERLHKALLVLPFSKKVKVLSGSGEKLSVPTGMGVTRQLFPEQADLEIRDIIRASIETRTPVKLPEEKPWSPSRPRPIELLDEDTSTNLPGTQLKAYIASKHSKANLTPPDMRAEVMEPKTAYIRSSCIRLIERYAACRCLYYRHPIDHALHGPNGCRRVEDRELLVGYMCSKHSTSGERKT